MLTPFKPTTQLSAILTAALLLTACNKADEQVSRKREPVKVIAMPVELNTQLTRVEVVGTSRARQSVVMHPASAKQTFTTLSQDAEAALSKNNLLYMFGHGTVGRIVGADIDAFAEIVL